MIITASGEILTLEKISAEMFRRYNSRNVRSHEERVPKDIREFKQHISGRMIMYGSSTEYIERYFN